MGRRPDARLARAVPGRGDVRARRRARGARPGRSGDRGGRDRGARRPALPDRVPRHDRRAGGAVLDRRRHGRHPRQARAPPPARVRRRRWPTTPPPCSPTGRTPSARRRVARRSSTACPRRCRRSPTPSTSPARPPRSGSTGPTIDGPLAKVDEELAELREALRPVTTDRIADELGDLVVATVNVARHAHVDAESAGTCRRRQVPPPVRGDRGAGDGARDRSPGRRPGDARRALGRGQSRGAGPVRLRSCGCSSRIRRITRTSGRCRSPRDLDDWNLPHMHGVLGLHRHVVRLVELGSRGRSHVLRRQGAARPARAAGVPAAARARRGPPADRARVRRRHRPLG